MSHSSYSLRNRLVQFALGLLLVFVLLTALVLDQALRNSTEAAQKDKLDGLTYILLSAAELDNDGVVSVDSSVLDPKFALPGSGLYASIRPNNGTWGAWFSTSTLGMKLDFGPSLAPGATAAHRLTAADGQVYRVASRGVRWWSHKKSVELTISVAEPEDIHQHELAAYRNTLWPALASVAVLLLLALLAVLHWGMRPLRQLARQLAAMEKGETRSVAGHYPQELAPLVNNLNLLLEREGSRLARHRAALGDLAHSLKTPLAVLRSAPDDARLKTAVSEQVARMDDIVQYQLQRASTAGASQSAPPLPLAPLIERLLASLAKVYQARQLQLAHQIPADLSLRIDEGDAMEVFGNLLDNACKWAKRQVAVTTRLEGRKVIIQVEDDGPGMPDDAALTLRGKRGDERTPGHGLGLTLVEDIVLAYDGELQFSRSALGGACAALWLTKN